MKTGRFQAKDIDDAFFLRCIDYAQTYHAAATWEPQPALRKREGRDATWPVWVFTWNLDCLMPFFPPEVIRAKASRLIRRGLLTGCDCGCRGDFSLTVEGARFLRQAGHDVLQPPALFLQSGGLIGDIKAERRVNAAGGEA